MTTQPPLGDLPDTGSGSVAEAKVSAATSTAGGIIGLVVVVLTALQGTIGILAVPAWAVAVIGAAVTVLTAAGTYYRAYMAPHTPRPDLDISQR